MRCFKLQKSIIVIFILIIGNIYPVVAVQENNLDNTINKAIEVVKQSNLKYPKEKINESDGIIVKIFKPAFTTTRKEAHQYAVGKKVENPMFSNIDTTKLKEEHNTRKLQISQLKNTIDFSYKKLNKFVKNQENMSQENRKQIRKSLSELRKYSKSTLHIIIKNYVSESEYNTVYTSIESVWNELNSNKLIDQKMLNKWTISMRQLKDEIPTYSFGEGNSHIWWLIGTCISISLVLIIVMILYAFIQSLPYLATEGIGVIFRELQEGYLRFIECILEKFRR